MLSLTLLAGLSPAAAEPRFCFLFCVYDTPGAVDGYVQNYERVIRNKDDAAVVKTIPDPVRKRIERNEALYLCSQGWNNPICQTVKKK